MAKLEIVKFPDEFLRKVSKPVTEFGGRLWLLLDDMVETMDASGGVGLAAVQVGRMVRVCVMRTEDDFVELVNPVIIESENLRKGDEGCLSIPNVTVRIKRFQRIVVQAWDRHGVAFIREFTGINAVCVQHEIDHMDGILITDYEGGK